MNKNKLYFFLINIITFAALMSVSFLFAEEYTSVFWCSVAFTLTAFLVETGVNSGFENKGIEAYFFGLPVMYYSIGYVAVQSAAGLIFSVFLHNVSLKIGFSVQLVIFAVYVISIISSLMLKNTLTEKNENRENRKSYMIFAAAKLNSIETFVTDRIVKAKIHSIYEMAKMSNPLVDTNLAPIEQNISDKISELDKRIKNNENAEEIIKDIKDLLNERNNICKVLK